MDQQRDDTLKEIQRFPYKPIKNHIKWYDAQSETGWIGLADMDKLRPAVSKTKGWIYKETDEYNYIQYSGYK